MGIVFMHIKLIEANSNLEKIILL